MFNIKLSKPTSFYNFSEETDLSSTANNSDKLETLNTLIISMQAQIDALKQTVGNLASRVAILEQSPIKTPFHQSPNDNHLAQVDEPSISPIQDLPLFEDWLQKDSNNPASPIQNDCKEINNPIEPIHSPESSGDKNHTFDYYFHGKDGRRISEKTGEVLPKRNTQTLIRLTPELRIKCKEVIYSCLQQKEGKNKKGIKNVLEANLPLPISDNQITTLLYEMRKSNKIRLDKETRMYFVCNPSNFTISY